MKAAFFEQPGPPDVIKYGDLPDPQPKPGEVLVKVAAAALNPIDTYIRSGLVKMPQPVPTIPGCDLAGTVVALGSGAKRFKVGDRVWGSNQGLLGRQGTFAELAAVGEEWLYSTPNGVSDEEAAAGALVGITAHLGLFRFAGLRAGETVFVNGGTGGVGSMVVQMAKAVGAKAITTVGSEAKAELARELGAAFVLNYKDDDVGASLKQFTGGKGVDVWYETQPPSDLDKTFDAMAWRGRVVVMAGRQARPAFPNGAFYTKDLAMFGFAMFKATSEEMRRCADDINRWLAEKKLRVTIGKSFALSEAAAAHRLQEENTLHKAGTLTGKIIVKPSSAMNKPFDATLNVLIDEHPEEWAAFLAARAGVPFGPVVPLDTDLSSTLQADKLFRINGPSPCVLHVELESSGRLGIPVELLRYNVVTHASTGLPVHSIIVLLRPKANASDLTGELTINGADGQAYLRFRYSVLRVWQEPMAAFLDAGLRLAPLALLTNEANQDVPAATERFRDRLQRGRLPGNVTKKLVQAALNLAGLRYDYLTIKEIDMSLGSILDDSSVSQEYLRRGIERGSVEQAQQMLLVLGRQRFGDIPPSGESTLRSIRDIVRLNRMAERVLMVASWDDLLATS